MIFDIADPTVKAARWRKRFAFLPKRIGDRRIWLERYAWRELNDDEIGRFPRPIFSTMSYREHREYVIKCDGYCAWRIRDHCMMAPMPLWSTEWKRPQPQRLRVVG